MKNLIIFITGGVIFFSSFHFQQKQDIQYFKNEFHPEKISRIEPRLIQFEDTIPNDTIYVCFTANEFPYAYFREIFTTVCLDKLCLPVWILFYWSPGGGYLGYTIKHNGILTKQEHSPFIEEDYKRLHDLLDDPQSILINYQLSDLVSDNHDTLQVDGISGATILDVENYVIKGAAYTTYTLWKTVYGPSNDSIRNISLEYLSTPFLESLIFSPVIQDNYFAFETLNRFNFKVTTAFIPKLEEFIISNDYFLKESSIDAIMLSGFSDSLIQRIFMNVFKGSDYAIKHRILRIFSAFSYLTSNTIEELINQLSEESVPIIQKVFDLLQSKAVLTITSKIEIAELLEHDNRFIAKIAYDYLSSLDNNEEILLEKIQKYEAKLSQNI